MEHQQNNGNGNVKFLIGLFTLICGVWLVSLTQGMIANDRMRALEDQTLEDKIGENKNMFHSIDKRLARIEDKLDIK